MALQILPTSKWFYGRLEVNGVKKSVNLGVEIKGKRPRTLREQGDAVFERSRGRAQEKLRELQAEARRKKARVEILQTIHEARTGERANSIPLRPKSGSKGMFEAWKVLPRKRKPSDRYIAQIESLFGRFIDFLEEQYPKKKILEMADVRGHMALRFMNSVEERGVSGKTYNNELIALRSAFESLSKEASLFENPFDGIPTKEENTVFRLPYDIDELSKIIEVAKRDEHSFIRPIIIVGICTAMRRGDCCLLSPRSVDFEQKFIRVKTSKTGAVAQIPLFPLLEEELRNLNREEECMTEYLFPEQAEMYLKNPDGITWRVKKVLKDAGYYDAENKKSSDANHIADTHTKREVGLRVASIRDFHSFRVSWVTLALTSGVDLELVKMVTGHKTVEIVLKHYFQPGREYFKHSLRSKMPGLLMNRENAETSDSRKRILTLIELALGLEAESNAALKHKLLVGLNELLETDYGSEESRIGRLVRQAN